jgi:hypothetical protein
VYSVFSVVTIPMSSSLQFIIALALVLFAVAYLGWNFFLKRKPPGCGSAGCDAVSPEIKKLQAKLKRSS